ncbi:MAG TPA: hypothetical protein VGM89_14465, partial [Puia sp.]
WKKQESKDERRLQKKEEDNEENSEADNDEATGNRLDDYGILLLPFYETNPTIPRFFDRLLRSRDPLLRLSTSLLLLRNHRPVADSILLALASADASRSLLYQGLDNIGMADRFPRRYRDQENIARSLLVAARGANEFAEIRLVDKQATQFKTAKGWVYFFQYKINKDDEWQIGLSGIQPAGRKDLSTDASLVVLTSKKLKTGVPALEQCSEQWRKLLLARRKSASSFFQDNEYRLNPADED